MRKQDFCICKNAGTDQLCSNCTADQGLCFCCRDGKISLIKFIAFFCDCKGWFASVLEGNPEHQLSHVAAHINFENMDSILSRKKRERTLNAVCFSSHWFSRDNQYN